MRTRSWQWGLGVSAGVHAAVAVVAAGWVLRHPATSLPGTAPPTGAPRTLFKVAMREQPGAPREPRETLRPPSGRAGTAAPHLEPAGGAPPSAVGGAARALDPSEAPPLTPSAVEGPAQALDPTGESPLTPNAAEGPARAFDPKGAAPLAPSVAEGPARALDPKGASPLTPGAVEGPGLALDLAAPGALTPGAVGEPGAAARAGAARGTGGVGTPPGAPGGPPGTSAGPNAGAAPPADVIADVHARLARAAQACAPAAARRFHLEGTVGLHFCVEAAGSASDVAIRGGSGQPLLDEAATTCVVPGAAPFPDAARGRCFDVPVHFSLR